MTATARMIFRVPADLAERFTALARGQGGKSVLLRRLVEDVVQAPERLIASGDINRSPTSVEGGLPRRGEGRDSAAAVEPLPAVTAALGPSRKVTLRLTEPEMARLADAARRRGMNRTQWMASLVRARLALGLPQTGEERVALRAIARELNRIGGNINQIARAANTEVASSGGPASIDATAISEAREAVEAATAELRFVLARSAGYWDVAP